MKAVLTAMALLFSSQIALADGLLMVKSAYPVMETLDRVESAAKATV